MVRCQLSVVSWGGRFRTFGRGWVHAPTRRRNATLLPSKTLAGIIIFLLFLLSAAIWRPIREEFRTGRRICPMAMAYLARKSHQISRDGCQMSNLRTDGTNRRNGKNLNSGTPAATGRRLFRRCSRQALMGLRNRIEFSPHSGRKNAEFAPDSGKVKL